MEAIESPVYESTNEAGRHKLDGVRQAQPKSLESKTTEDRECLRRFQYPERDGCGIEGERWPRTVRLDGTRLDRDPYGRYTDDYDRSQPIITTIVEIVNRWNRGGVNRDNCPGVLPQGVRPSEVSKDPRLRPSVPGCPKV